MEIIKTLKIFCYNPDKAIILKPAITKTKTVITIAMIIVTIHITKAWPHSVSYITLMIKRFTITATINPIKQKPSQVNTDVHIEKVITNNIVVPKATRRPLSSSKILAVKYNGRAMKMSSRIIKRTKIRISKPQ